MLGPLQNTTFRSDELTRYTAGDTRLESHSRTKNVRALTDSGGRHLRTDPEAQHRLEADYWRTNEPGINDTHTDFTAAGIPTRTESRYDAHNRQNNLSATFNYIFKLDTAGSTLKLLADYNLRSSIRATTIPAASPCPAARSIRSTATADGALQRCDRHAGPRQAFRPEMDAAGRSQSTPTTTCATMRSTNTARPKHGCATRPTASGSTTRTYSRRSTALCGDLGRCARGRTAREYTRTAGKNDGTRQDYFSLFPNAASPMRSPRRRLLAHRPVCPHIGRPRFWCLNPQRVQIRTTTIRRATRNSKPSYKHDVKPDPGAGSKNIRSRAA